MPTRLGRLRRFRLGKGRPLRSEACGLQSFAPVTGSFSQALFPHKSALLADGIVGSGKVICPLHSYQFDLETGKPVANGCEPLQTYFVKLSEDGNLQLCLETPD